MNIIEIQGGQMRTLQDENFPRSFLRQSDLSLEARKFGKPLTNTYRNQDYIKYLKKRGTWISKKEPLKTVKCFQSQDLFSYSQRETEKKVNSSCNFDSRMQIDELYEESIYKYNPQYNIELIKEITSEMKSCEVRLHKSRTSTRLTLSF
jgi:hypothetical protein